MVLYNSKFFQEIMEAQNAIEGLRLLHKKAIDLIICKVVMPEMDGFRFLEIIKNDSRFQNIPVIMLSESSSVENAVWAFDKGAVDYISHPFNHRVFIARCLVQLKVKKLQDELRKLSLTDELTRLYNRRHFLNMFEKEFLRSQRHNLNLGFLILDIDHFKRVNDTYGHQAGDIVLKELARILCNQLRRHDVPARYGGEEFVILLPQTDYSGAEYVGCKILQAVYSHTFEEVAWPISVSIGMEVFPGKELNHIDDIIRRADSALYRAKKDGRNRLCVSDPSVKGISDMYSDGETRLECLTIITEEKNGMAGDE